MALMTAMQDLHGFDDDHSERSERSESFSDGSGIKPHAAAKRDMAVAELKDLKTSLEGQGKARAVAEGAELIALRAEVESLRSELVQANIREAQVSVARGLPSRA